MNTRQLSLYFGVMIATSAGPSMAQDIPRSNSVDWGGGYVRYVRDPAGVTAATLTGVMKTLESRQLLRRKTDRADGRRVLVALTTSGRKVVDEIMPAFNRHEGLVTQALTEAEQVDLAHVLRTILRTVEAIDL